MYRQRRLHARMFYRASTSVYIHQLNIIMISRSSMVTLKQPREIYSAAARELKYNLNGTRTTAPRDFLDKNTRKDFFTSFVSNCETTLRIAYTVPCPSCLPPCGSYKQQGIQESISRLLKVVWVIRKRR